ncbi:LacI family DNA-binding transcriptional regulator [Gorillibacterium massiliense]|uniref:LacI family DNA-binding transcriptional regulator n=1 Tax=Gorillibacterium massiliense TaxID=1280390 RepID=UPI0004B5DEC6|nr:LacI family DNA-binding transcriptional regulator [Gorillibacterium massiliense]
MPKNKITIQQIADLAGVNKATVSRVLNGNTNISEKTRQKIESIMKEHDYVPNTNARGLAFNKTFTIGFCFDYTDKKAFANPFFYKVMSGIEDAVYGNDYLFLMMSDHNKGKGKSTFERVVAEHRVDGVLIPDTLLTPDNYRLLMHHGMPFVVIGETMLPEVGIHWVDVDNSLAGQLLTETLIAQGYRNISLYADAESLKRDKFIADRIQGYRRAMDAHGMSPRIFADAGSFRKAVRSDGSSAERLAGRADALICCTNDQLFDVLDPDNGGPLAADIGLATFDDLSMHRYLKRNVHYVVIDLEQMGHKAAELLFSLVNKAANIPDLIRIPTTKVIESNAKRTEHDDNL